MKKCGYSTIDEIVQIDVLFDFSDEEIRTAVNELRIASMEEFIY